MQRVRFEHEFQAALLDADSAWRDLCEFVSFRTIVRELTLRARMRRVCRSSCFRRRHVSCVSRHTITIQGSVMQQRNQSAHELRAAMGYADVLIASKA